MAPIEVLLLEERPSRRRTLSRRLRSRGFRVRFASSPEDLGDPADVLLWAQDGTNGAGLDALPRIRAVCPSLPVLVLLSDASGALAREAIRSGADHVLASTARITDIDLAIHQLIERIARRNQARQKLTLYRQIYDRSYDGIVVLDADGRFVERNPIHRQLSGFSDEDLIGRPAGDLFGADVVGRAIEIIRETGSYRGELVAPRADGTAIPIEVSAFSILDAAGDVLYYVAMGRDISKRKRAEEDLKRAHDELERRVDERTAELAELNAKLESEIVERREAEEALRRSHELLSKQNAVLAEFSKRLTPEDGNVPAQLGELNRAASSTLAVARVSVWMYGDDGSFIECLDLYDAGSEQHVRGQRLSKVDFPAYFRALGEHRSIAAHDAHRDPRTREFSESYLTPFGISSMLDAPIWLEGKMVGVVCHEHVGAPRTWTPEEERFAASVADFASLTLEMHQRFRAEQALQKAHDELESRVEQRTAQLARMNFAYREELNERRQAQEDLARANRELRDAQAQLVQSEKMASLGMLVAGIAHEIHTPLGAIRSMRDTQARAVRKLESILAHDHPEMLSSTPALESLLATIHDADRVIETGCERVTEIVRRLRSFARLDEAELKEVDLHEGLDDTLGLLQHETKHKIAIHREYGDVPRIECSPGRLNQVFLNLLNNARQAIEDNGAITIRTFVRGDHVHIAVSDTGSGIHPDHLDKIFDPGFTTKGVGVGTGLGLSICYQIIKDHGGEIRVTSELGRGTTFTVVLPVRRGSETPLAGASAHRRAG